ncbi:MAG: hypothetical protein H7330_12195 [Hymenobacteraceae bacterium]|nr:hypothetical protein [Hymenobacteraceae bacterium]
MKKLFLAMLTVLIWSFIGFFLLAVLWPLWTVLGLVFCVIVTIFYFWQPEVTPGKAGLAWYVTLL